VRETPGPIPNPEVKPHSVDGTARGTVWESRTSPGIFLERGCSNAAPFSVLYQENLIVSYEKFIIRIGSD